MKIIARTMDKLKLKLFFSTAGQDKTPQNKLRILFKHCLRSFITLIIVIFIIFIILFFIIFIFNKWTEKYTNTSLGQKASMHMFAKNTTKVAGRPETPTADPPVMACGVPVENGPMIKVGDHKTYVIGSYVEHRQGVKKVKTVAIMLRSEVAEYYCLFCCNNRTFSVPASYDIHSDHFGFEYGTGDIVCEMPPVCTSDVYVAITSESHNGKEALQNIQSFQPVRNLQTKEEFPYKFTVCISVMYDYDNVLGLVQALEMYRILGAQRVAIYKTSAKPTAQKVLDFYVKQGFVEIIPWPVTSYINVSRGSHKQKSPGELHYFGQIAALNDCLYRYMYQTQYINLHDLDEFILPISVSTWTELLPQLESTHGRNVGFEFEENRFPLYLKDSDPKYEPDLWKNVTGVNVLEHIKRVSIDPKRFNNFKVIVNPRLVFKTTVHGVLQSVPRSVRVDHNIGRMYHFSKTTSPGISESNCILDTHLRDYADKLIPAVSAVLQQVLS